MRFSGIAESISPVGSFSVENPDQGAAFRSGPVQAIGMRRKERIRWFHPSVQMSSGRLFLTGWSPPEPAALRRRHQHNRLAVSPASKYHRTVTCVLTGCLSPGDHRNVVYSAE